MKATVTWVGGRAFDGVSGSGHKLRMDGPPEVGGENSGFRPMEMLLLGLGGCASFDVVGILQKSRQKIAGCVAEVTAERAADVPKVFTKIHIVFRISGTGIDRSKAERAADLSAEKYCSASLMLSKTAEITHEVVIEEE